AFQADGPPALVFGGEQPRLGGAGVRTRVCGHDRDTEGGGTVRLADVDADLAVLLLQCGQAATVLGDCVLDDGLAQSILGRDPAELHGQFGGDLLGGGDLDVGGFGQVDRGRSG